MRFHLTIASLVALLSLAAQAQPVRRTLEVGPGKPFENLTAAAAAARDGDRVLITAGLHQDCAVWRVNQR